MIPTESTEVPSINSQFFTRSSSEIVYPTDSIEILKTATEHHNHIFEQFDLTFSDLGAQFSDEKLVKYLGDLNKTLKKRFDFPENHFFYKDLVELVDHHPGFMSNPINRVLYTKNLTNFSKKVIDCTRCYGQTFVLAEILPIIYLSEISNESLLKVLRCDYTPNEKLEVLMECGMGTLQDLIDFLKARGITYPSLLLDLKHDLSDQLRILSENDLVHRDIKPDNIMLTKDFHFKLTDYGSCEKILAHELQTMTIVGTYAYMNPELKRAYDNQDECVIDPYQADEYAATRCLMHAKEELEGCGLIVEKDKIMQLFEASIVKSSYDKIQDQRKKNDILSFLFEHRKFEDLKILMKDELKRLDAGKKDNISRILFIYDKLGDIAAIDLNLEDAFGYYILGANLIVQNLYEENNIADSCFYLLIKAGKLCLRRDKFDQAMKYLKHFQDIAESQKEPVKMSIVYDYLALCYLKLDKIDQAIKHIELEYRTLEDLRLQKDDHSFYRYYRTNGFIALKQNNYLQAQLYLRKAMKLILMESIEDYYELFEIYSNLFKIFSSEKLLEIVQTLPNLQELMALNPPPKAKRTPNSIRKVNSAHDELNYAIQSIYIWALKYGKDFLDSLSMVFGKESIQLADAQMLFGSFLLKFASGFEETAIKVLRESMKNYSKIMMDNNLVHSDCYSNLGRAMLSQNPLSEDGKKMIQTAFDMKIKTESKSFEAYKDYIDCSVQFKICKGESIRHCLNLLMNHYGLKTDQLKFLLLNITELYKDKKYASDFEVSASKIVFQAIKTLNPAEILFSDGFVRDLFLNLGVIFCITYRPTQAQEKILKAFKSIDRNCEAKYTNFYLNLSEQDRISFFSQQIMLTIQKIGNELEDYFNLYVEVLIEEARRLLYYPNRPDFHKRKLCSFPRKLKQMEISDILLEFYFKYAVHYCEIGENMQAIHYINLLDLFTLNNYQRRTYYLYIKWCMSSKEEQKDLIEEEIMEILNSKNMDNTSILITLEFLCIINLLNKDYQRALEYIHRMLIWIKNQIPNATKYLIKALKMAVKAYHHNFYDLISDQHLEIINNMSTNFISSGNIEIIDNFDTHGMLNFVNVAHLKKALALITKNINPSNFRVSLYLIFTLEIKTRGRRDFEEGTEVTKGFLDLVAKLETLITNSRLTFDVLPYLEIFTNIFTAKNNPLERERHEIFQNLISISSHRFRTWEENVEFYPKEQKLYLLLQNYGRVIMKISRLFAEAGAENIAKTKERVLYGTELFFTTSISNQVGKDTELNFIFPENADEEVPDTERQHFELNLKYNPKKIELRPLIVKNLLEYVDPASLSTTEITKRKISEDKVYELQDQLDLEIVEEENHEFTSRTSLGSLTHLDNVPSKTSLESLTKIDSIKQIINQHTASLEDKAIRLEDYDIEIAREYEWLGLLALFDRNMQDSLKFLKNSLEIREVKSQDDPVSIARAHDKIGIVYQIQGQMPLAKECHEKALKIKLEHLKDIDYELIPTYQLLILVNIQLGVLEETAEFQNKICKIQLNHETIMENRQEIYSKWVNMFDLPEVNNFEPTLRKISGRILDYLDPKMKSYLWDILGFLFSKISLLEAEDSHNNGLVCRRLYQSDYHCLISYEYLSSVCDQDYIALDWRRKAERLKKKVFGNHHLEVVLECFKIGDILFHIKQYQKAIDSYISGLKLLAPGFEPRCLINIYFNVAMCQANQKGFLKAIFNLRKVISLKNSFEYKEETYIREYEHIYLFEIIEEQLEEVELTLNRILKIYLKNQEKYFLDIIKVRVFIFSLQIEKFPLNLSEMDFTPLTKDLRVQQEGWQIAMGLRFMAEVYQKQQNFAKSIEYYQKLKTHLTSFLGSDHVEVIALNQYFESFNDKKQPIGDVSSRSNTSESFINKRLSLHSEGNERLNKYFESEISVKKILFEVSLWETRPGLSELLMKNMVLRRSISTMSPRKSNSNLKRKVKFSGHKVSVEMK